MDNAVRRLSLRPLIPKIYHSASKRSKARYRLAVSLAFGIFFLLYCLRNIDDEIYGSETAVNLQKNSSMLRDIVTGSVTCDDLRSAAHGMREVERIHPSNRSDTIQLEGWEDEWISRGVLPPSPIQAYKLDTVYTFVRNDVPFSTMKAPYDAVLEEAQYPGWHQLQARRYRSWDELRYSIRGTLRYADSWLSRIYIVAKDFVLPETETTNSTYVLQVPQWLSDKRLQDDSLLRVVPESSIVMTEKCGQTFNSVSVEASLGYVDTEQDRFIALSDDMMFGRHISSSDFANPLHGMAMSMYEEGWEIDSDEEPNLNDMEKGEGHPARYTSFLLNKRFGKRPRTLQIHQAKVLHKDILDEAMNTFPRAALLTPLSTYRDDSQQLYPWYLHMHYVIEMHREALLWAISLASDTDEDGVLSFEERQALVDRIDRGRRNAGRSEATPMLDRMVANLASAGLEALSVQTPLWTSMDGPVHLRGLSREDCEATFSFTDVCLGEAFASDDDTTEPWSIERLFHRLTDPSISVACGDCLIKILLDDGAELGLGALLPARGSKDRERAVKAIHRYAYTSTAPDNAFRMVKTLADAQDLLPLAAEMPGLLCINDDMMMRDSGTLERVAAAYRDFFEAAYPGPSDYEITS